MKKFTINIDDLQSLNFNEVFNEFFTQHEEEITKYFSDCLPDIDIHTYEDGIYCWFGLGSVMLHELGFEPELKFNCHTIELTL
jgi:hypothetical protein